MARPRSEEKRNAILSAATREIAENGLGAPTARIAKLAGVAEGSLFTYFSNKNELFNHLYLEIKEELREAMMGAFPRAGSVRNRILHVWKKYVNWGVTHPQKRRTLATLGMCDSVSETTKAAGMQSFSEIGAMVQESMAKGLLREQPPAFVASLMTAIAEATMDFMIKNPSESDRFCDSGFEAFWNAIVKK